MSGERELILRRIRAALADVPPGEAELWSVESDHGPVDSSHAQGPDASYARRLQAGPEATLELFAERCGDYRATVTRCGPDAAEVRAAIAEICSRQGVRRLVAPAGIEPDWLPEAVAVDHDDGSLTAGELTGYDGALSGCALAIALTGTIVLDAGATQGRRLLSLIPDLHVCVVEARQVVGSVPEAVALMAAAARARRPLTMISGPSATSDIELVRVEGVHGPRRLEVVLAGHSPSEGVAGR